MTHYNPHLVLMKTDVAALIILVVVGITSTAAIGFPQKLEGKAALLHLLLWCALLILEDRRGGRDDDFRKRDQPPHTHPERGEYGGRGGERDNRGFGRSYERREMEGHDQGKDHLQLSPKSGEEEHGKDRDDGDFNRPLAGRYSQPGFGDEKSSSSNKRPNSTSQNGNQGKLGVSWGNAGASNAKGGSNQGEAKQTDSKSGGKGWGGLPDSRRWHSNSCF